MTKWIAGAVAALLLAGPAALAEGTGDPAKGQQAFTACKVCHSLEAGKNMMGPSLHGLIGRKAGTAPDYNYSGAMKNAGVTWDDANLTKYLTDPKAFVPGDKMAFPGIKDPTRLADLLAYLHQATQ